MVFADMPTESRAMLRRTPLKQVSAKRAARAALKQKPLKRSTFKRKKAKNAPNKDEKAYHAKVGELHCQLMHKWSAECRDWTTVSHRPGAGMALKSSHYDVAAICRGHHLVGPNSIEAMGIKAWERKYGEHEIYEEMTRKAINGDVDIRSIALTLSGFSLS